MAALLLFACCGSIATAQVVTRVPTIHTTAGNGTAGYSGDSGPAGSAELNNPAGVVIDNAGSLYIADPGNQRVRKVAAGTGLITTLAGNGTAGYSGDNGPAAAAELNAPAGVAIDSAGNLYIADTGNHVIRKVSASGTITTVAGNNAQGYSGDNGLATNATLDTPTGVAVDSGGDLFIADTNNNRIRKVDASGTITTVVGNGTEGYTGDGGPATSATLNKPAAVVVDSMGNLFLVDTGNDVVRMVTTAGTISTVAGNGGAGYSGDGGPATSARLNVPSGLKVDSSGDLYIADSMNDVVRLVNTAGVISTLAGNATNGYSGDGGPATSAALNNPRDVALDSQANLYISDRNNHRVREVDTPTGSVPFPATAVGATSAAVTIPLVVNTGGTTITAISVPVSQGNKQEYAVTGTGCALNTALSAATACNVTVTFSPGYAGQRPVPLQVVSSAGTFAFAMTGIGTAPQLALSPGIITTLPVISDVFSGLYGDLTGSLVVDSAGNLYLTTNAGLDGNGVFEIAAGTSTVTTVLTFGNGPTDLDFGIAVDGAGNVYVVNPNFSNVVKLAPGSTTATDVAGLPFSEASFGGGNGYSGDNGPATSAELNFPAAVAVDSAGNLYIADTRNNRIRKVAAVSGIITTIAGTGTAGYGGDNGPATSAELNNPKALTLDAAGNLYIADGNTRIRKLTAATGLITTVAGNGTVGYSGDNGLATSAELSYLTGLAVDAAGDIYMADSGNSVIRMVNAAGIITTVAGNGTRGDAGDNGPATDAEVDAEGVALDGAGNLYVPQEAFPTAVRQVNTSTSALSFGNTSAGSTNTQTAAVTNIGNAPLTFAAPASGQNPSISTGFTHDSSSTCPQLSAGSPTFALSSGTACNLVIDFMPTAAGTVTGTATISDNSLNVNTLQTVQLSGAAQTVATTTTINVATPTVGQTQVSATVLATAGTAMPAGSVVFTVDGAGQPAVTLNASAVATLPSAVSNALAAGSHTIGAVYTSSSVEFGNSNASRIFSVAAVPPSLTVAPGSMSLTVVAGGSVTDTLTATSVGGYSGALQFSCSNLPQNASCTFQPPSLTVSGASGPQKTVLTIQTAGNTAELGRPATAAETTLLSAAFWSPGFVAIVLAGRRRRPGSRNFYWLVLLALVSLSGAAIGCGGSSPTAKSTTPVTPVTPAGTSTVQVSATASGTTVQSFTLTLTVQ